MRFLRMLTNSLLAGAFGAAYLTIIVLQLNPGVPLLSATPWWWFATFGMLYGVHLAVVLYVIIVAREFFTMDVLSPGWVGAWLFVIAVVASMALPIAARGAGDSGETPIEPGAYMTGMPPEEHGPRVMLVLLDGASLEYIWPRAAEGRLPNFSRLLDGGAVIDLATIRPTQPDPVWTAVATGMYPAINGVRSAARYYARNDRRGIDLLPDHCFSHALVRLGLVRDEPRTSD